MIKKKKISNLKNQRKKNRAVQNIQKAIHNMLFLTRMFTAKGKGLDARFVNSGKSYFSFKIIDSVIRDEIFGNNKGLLRFFVNIILNLFKA